MLATWSLDRCTARLAQPGDFLGGSWSGSVELAFNLTTVGHHPETPGPSVMDRGPYDRRWDRSLPRGDHAGSLIGWAGSWDAASGQTG
jgi:hypothetical protein